MGKGTIEGPAWNEFEYRFCGGRERLAACAASRCQLAARLIATPTKGGALCKTSTTVTHTSRRPWRRAYDVGMSQFLPLEFGVSGVHLHLVEFSSIKGGVFPWVLFCTHPLYSSITLLVARLLLVP